MNAEVPSISIIIPAYNAARSIYDCLSSLDEAVRFGVEVIVVDDGSSDETALIAQSWSNSGVHLIKQDNAGPGVARNAGAREARANYVAFVDSDDRLHAGWAPFFERAADRHLPPDLITCGMSVSSPSGDSWLRTPSDMGPAYLGLHALMLPGAYAVRRSLFLSVGGFDPAVTYGEHHELALRLAPHIDPAKVISDDSILIHKNHDRGPARVAGYAQARLAASEYILKRHSSQISTDSKMVADLHSVAANAAWSLGLEKRRIIRHSWAAVRHQPRMLRRWLRLVLTMLPVHLGAKLPRYGRGALGLGHGRWTA